MVPSTDASRYRVLVGKSLQNREQPFTELFLHILAKSLVDLDLVTPLAIWVWLYGVVFGGLTYMYNIKENGCMQTTAIDIA